jgi:hypothetical protein
MKLAGHLESINRIFSPERLIVDSRLRIFQRLGESPAEAECRAKLDIIFPLINRSAEGFEQRRVSIPGLSDGGILGLRRGQAK